MGLFNKIKDIFSEEVDDEPVKSQMVQVEIGNKADFSENISDNTVLNKEEVKEKKIYFDDEDFDTLVAPKEKPKVYGFKEVTKGEEKEFRASPVISPIYGILDKNYHKEDIKNKAKAHDYVERASTKVGIDEIRRKAFGTLEDVIEEDLFKAEPFVIEEEAEIMEQDLFDELDFNLDGEPDSKEDEEFKLDYVLNVPKADSLLEDLEEPKKPELELDYVATIKKEEPLLTELTEEAELKNVLTEDLNKDDLFDLIDSMYEKEDE